MMRYLLVVLLLASAVSASAAEVGRFELNGRTIIVESDRTWHFLDEVAADTDADCTVLSSAVFPVKFCLDDTVWRRDPESGNFEMLFNTISGDLYFGVISEEVYVDPDTLKKAILSNAQSSAGLKGVIKQSSRTSRIDEHDWDVLEYDVEFGSTPFTFSNYNTSITDVGTVQLVFWTASSVFDKYEDVQDDVVRTLSIIE